MLSQKQKDIIENDTRYFAKDALDSLFNLIHDAEGLYPEEILDDEEKMEEAMMEVSQEMCRVLINVIQKRKG